MTSRRTFAVLVATALLVSACGREGHPTAQPSPSEAGVAAGVAVSLVRSGGFAGLRDEIAVDPDGAWRSTGESKGRRAGRLTEAQRADLARLAADPRLRDESARSPGSSRCSDAYTYALTVGTVRVSFVDCSADTGTPPAAAALVAFVTRAVWGASTR